MLVPITIVQMRWQRNLQSKGMKLWMEGGKRSRELDHLEAVLQARGREGGRHVAAAAAAAVAGIEEGVLAAKEEQVQELEGWVPLSAVAQQAGDRSSMPAAISISRCSWIRRRNPGLPKRESTDHQLLLHRDSQLHSIGLPNLTYQATMQQLWLSRDYQLRSRIHLSKIELCNHTYQVTRATCQPLQQEHLHLVANQQQLL